MNEPQNWLVHFFFSHTLGIGVCEAFTSQQGERAEYFNDERMVNVSLQVKLFFFFLSRKMCWITRSDVVDLHSSMYAVRNSKRISASRNMFSLHPRGHAPLSVTPRVLKIRRCLSIDLTTSTAMTFAHCIPTPSVKMKLTRMRMSSRTRPIHNVTQAATTLKS